MPCRERGWGKKVVGKCALLREEENDPSGETIGAEMAKRMRDGHTHTHTNKHTSVREIYKRILCVSWTYLYPDVQSYLNPLLGGISFTCKASYTFLRYIIFRPISINETVKKIS